MNQFDTSGSQSGSISATSEMRPDLNATSPDQVFVQLHKWYWVHIEIYDSVRHQLGDVCDYLDPGETYMARELCGYGFWKLLSKGEAKLAGSCLSQMALDHALPLVKVSADGVYPNRYQLTGAPGSSQIRAHHAVDLDSGGG